MNREQAEHLLKTALSNPAAQFREGQWEAIDALVNERKKLLVVQRTGWGKSSVYFISTKILRERGMGPTIIISPLLALMRNQIESASRLGIIAETLNSTNKDDWKAVTKRVLDNKVDCLLISPERFSNQEFMDELLNPIADRIALMVIDEAHCISDWGHDFRPDYLRIVNILRQIPPNTPVLGTTATANDRVVNDIKSQFGNIEIQRGKLTRESLELQTLLLPDQPSRLAWLAQVIPSLAGTGIIYVLTQRDADMVSNWLNNNHVIAASYYSGVTHPRFVDSKGKNSSDIYRENLEKLLLTNNLKVLVATNALGMGYDKPDLSFVIHYQAPGSIVAYYQQVGRAGRGIARAVGILMSGKEDHVIHEYFRSSAFPSENQVKIILAALTESDGLSIKEIEENTNLSNGQIEKTLKLLSVENPSPIIKDDKKWKRTPVHYQLDVVRIARLTDLRKQEWSEVQEYISEKKCKMAYLRKSLDDNDPMPCGKCETCLGRPIINVVVDAALIHAAALFLQHAEMILEPRKQIAVSNAETARAFPIYQLPRLLGALAAKEGRVLSQWGDAGWGKIVADGKHKGYFDDYLVDAMAQMIKQRWQPTPEPTWICCVPSKNHPELVPNFAKRLAIRLGLPFVNAVSKVRDNHPQKGQQNSFHQCKNLDGAFSIDLSNCPEHTGPVFLIDDVVDSKWTLTVIAALLQQAGSGCVYPVALASSSVKDS